MSMEKNIRRLFDAYNEGDVTSIVGLFSDTAEIEYAGGIEKGTKKKGKQQIMSLFKTMLSAKSKVKFRMSMPKTILVKDDMAVIEWSSMVMDESKESAIVRGVNILEAEGDKIRRMTVYLPTPAKQPMGLMSGFSVKDLGELSLLAWAIV
jgi:hypothetical protein